MFELTDQPIDSAALRARLTRADAGACVVFEGWVRNHHLGQPVTQLEYEAFDALTKLEGETIVTEAEQTHPGTHVLCVHRTGTLGIGEPAVWIGAACAHRHSAFLACRYVIEELKRRLPVWKKEHHPGGAAEWVNCTTEAVANRLAPENYYERQIALREVGTTGQAKLAGANVLVVGVGGLGCPAALYLANAGVGRLALADAGKVEVSNLHRQILFTADDIGAPKVAVAAARLRAHNPFVRGEPFATEVTAANVRALVVGRTVVLDCTDNFATRFLLHDACRSAGVPLVSAAIHRFEGELNVFLPDSTACLHCLWPGRQTAELDTAGNCAGGPVFAPAVGVLGVMQAAETLKLILGTAGVASRETRLVNLLDGSSLNVERVPNPGCPVCGQPTSAVPAIPESDDAEPVVVDSDELSRFGELQVVVLLEAGEVLDSSYASTGAIGVAVGDLVRLREIASAGPTLLACRSGIRSATLARLLRSEGVRHLHALAGRSPAIRVGVTS